MSRISINFPWIFNSLSGKQPAQDLDDNFDAAAQGNVTIGTRVLAGSYVMVADDEYSFLLCVPTANMNITLPSNPPANFSFFVSNQVTAKNVTLIAPLTIEGQQVLNPVLPGNFGSLNNVIGGLCVFDGSTWSMYPKLYQL